jgi:hypothetical protein
VEVKRETSPSDHGVNITIHIPFAEVILREAQLKERVFQAVLKETTAMAEDMTRMAMELMLKDTDD